MSEPSQIPRDPSELEQLLGGWAAGVLSQGERDALMTAALEDQALFNALADEESLRATLADPAARQQLLAALQGAPQPWTAGEGFLPGRDAPPASVRKEAVRYSASLEAEPQRARLDLPQAQLSPPAAPIRRPGRRGAWWTAVPFLAAVAIAAIWLGSRDRATQTVALKRPAPESVSDRQTAAPPQAPAEAAPPRAAPRPEAPKSAVGEAPTPPPGPALEARREPPRAAAPAPPSAEQATQASAEFHSAPAEVRARPTAAMPRMAALEYVVERRDASGEYRPAGAAALTAGDAVRIRIRPRRAGLLTVTLRNTASIETLWEGPVTGADDVLVPPAGSLPAQAGSRILALKLAPAGAPATPEIVEVVLEFAPR